MNFQVENLHPLLVFLKLLFFILYFLFFIFLGFIGRCFKFNAQLPFFACRYGEDNSFRSKGRESLITRFQGFDSVCGHLVFRSFNGYRWIKSFDFLCQLLAIDHPCQHLPPPHLLQFLLERLILC